jgi:hypothetical protein
LKNDKNAPKKRILFCSNLDDKTACLTEVEEDEDENEVE